MLAVAIASVIANPMPMPMPMPYPQPHPQGLRAPRSPANQPMPKESLQGAESVYVPYFYTVPYYTYPAYVIYG